MENNKKKKCVISTPSVNSYGFRVLTEGINVDNFKNNPLLLFMHNRADNKDTLPIGRIEEIEFVDDKLVGTPIFDENDEFARQIKEKWDNGFLNMVSAGLEVLETSDDYDLVLEGQTLSTVTKCELKEVSIVDFGANKDALGYVVNLSKEDNKDYSTILNKLNLSSNDKCNDVKVDEKLTKAVRLSNEQIYKRLNDVSIELNTTLQDLDKIINNVNDKVADFELFFNKRMDNIDKEFMVEKLTLLDVKLNDNSINPNKKCLFEKIANKLNIEEFRELLDLFEKPQKISNLIDKSAVKNKLSDYSIDELKELYDNNRDKYTELYNNTYKK